MPCMIEIFLGPCSPAAVGWPTDTQYMTDENEVRNPADMYSIQFIEENCLTILCVINNATGQLR